MASFIQLLGTDDKKISPGKMCIAIHDIREITEDAKGHAVLSMISVTQRRIYTENNYDEFIECLSGMDSVEVF